MEEFGRKNTTWWLLLLPLLLVAACDLAAAQECTNDAFTSSTSNSKKEVNIGGAVNNDDNVADRVVRDVCKWDVEAGREKCHSLSDNDDDDSIEDGYYGGEDIREDEEYHEEDDEGISEDEDEEYHEEEDEEYQEEYHEGISEDEEYYQYRKHPENGEEWDVWKHGGKTEIYYALNCPKFNLDTFESQDFENTSFENIHTIETWKTFNRIYNEIIADARGDPELEQDSTIPPTFGKHGFQFPIEIKFDRAVGRGVYALTDIPKGSLLYLSTNNAAFLHGQTFRNFMKALPSKLACDVVIWSFVRWVSLESEENDRHMVCVDLDEGSFINSANNKDDYNMALGNDDGIGYDEGTEEENRQLWFGCKMKFWASRDIRAGEEIRADYSDFAEIHGWKYLGL